MGTHAIRDNARIIVLAGATLLLGSWHVLNLDPEPASQPAPDPFSAGPESERMSAAVPSEASRETISPQGLPDATPAADQDRMWSGIDVHAAHEPAPERAYNRILDTVFAPQRMDRDSVASSAASIDETVVSGFAMTGTASASQPHPTPTAVADATSTRKHPGTEKAYYEEFIAVAKEDARELERQAAVVLREAGGTNKKVALLCALYSTDSSQALNYFVSAITTLPDVTTPQGVSVPVFAAGFLGKQANDPAAKALAERIAWTSYLDVSPELRRVAARAVLANASETDLRRYAASGYQVEDVAVAGDRTP